MITEQELKKLYRDQAKLQALEAGGVDNWVNYDDSLEKWYAQNELEEKRAELLNELICIFGECAYEPSETGAGIAFREGGYDSAMKTLEHLGVVFCV